MTFVLPITFDEIIQQNIDEAWYKPSNDDYWEKSPGKGDFEMWFSSTIYNITNPDEILAGSKPIVTEIGEVLYLEDKRYDWEYVDSQQRSLGRDKSSTRISYLQTKDFVKKNQCDDWDDRIYIPNDLPVTAINVPTLMALYGVQTAPFVIGSLWQLHDLVVWLQSGFIDSYEGFIMQQKFFYNSTICTDYFESLGFDDEEALELYADSTYGWANPLNFNHWIRAGVEYNRTQDEYQGILGILNDHFQFPFTSLSLLVEYNSTFWDEYQVIKAAERAFYQTDDPYYLGLIQWSQLALLAAPILDADFSAVIPPGFPPSAIFFNATNYGRYNIFPEVYAFMLAGGFETDAPFTNLANTFLEYQYTYPMTNNASVLSQDGIGQFFSLYLDGTDEAFLLAQEKFHLDTKTQQEILAQYIGYLGLLPVDPPGYESREDGYARAIGRWATSSLVDYTTQMKDDLYFGPPSRLMFCAMKAQQVTCTDYFVQFGILGTKAVQMCETLGWNIFDQESWKGLEFWAKAALKNSMSLEFQTLLEAGIYTWSELNEALYGSSAESIYNSIKLYQANLKIELSLDCSVNKTICTRDELFYIQWSTSQITATPLADLQQCGFITTDSISVWYPEKYDVKLEWFPNIGKTLTKDTATFLMNYDNFLSPLIVTRFLNSYHFGNQTKTAEDFFLPTVDIVEDLYSYFNKIIPAFDTFLTRTVNEWIEGFDHPFLKFISNLDVYSGGNPGLNYTYAVQGLTDYDAPEKNPTIMHSGKGDTDKTNYVKQYYGTPYCRLYSNGYDQYSPTARSWQYHTIWDESVDGPIPLSGSFGSKFKSHLDKDDKPIIFSDDVRRGFEMDYDDTHYHHGLRTYKFIIPQKVLKNSAQNPDNAKWYQYPEGLEGYVNMTAAAGGPYFLSLPHCQFWEEEAQNHVEYYGYTNNSSTLGARIYPSSEDKVSLYIEPTTGATIKANLKLQTNYRFMRDYYFRHVYQTKGNKGLYIPYYVKNRSLNYTDHQVHEYFGTLMLTQQIDRLLPYIGYSIGPALFLTGVLLGVFFYKNRNEDDDLSDAGTNNEVKAPFINDPFDQSIN